MIKDPMDLDIELSCNHCDYEENLSVSESTDDDTGALETIKGNTAKTRSFQISTDNINTRIYNSSIHT